MKLRAEQAGALSDLQIPELASVSVALVVHRGDAALASALAALRQLAPAARIAVEVRNAAEATAAERLGADLLVAKGYEAGGSVGMETTFLLVQRLVASTTLPVIGQGGVAPETAAALRVIGAAGVLLDWPLALAEEAELPEAARRAVARMDGSETYCLGGHGDQPIRVFARTMRDIPEPVAALDVPGADPSALRAAIDAAVNPADCEERLLLVGQDAAFAKPLADRYGRVKAILDAVAQAAQSHPAKARDAAALSEGAPLAQTLGTRFPIVQGPMTRVSDRAEFALAVAEGGALPFLALALMRKDEADALIAETRTRLGDRPFGVGILGFVDEELRAEQMAVIAARRPDFALIAGGQPEQALALERQGIPTFLHVPSPGLLKLFLDAGARRFIFEGSECGGHVGPRSSAVLWQQAITTILDAYRDKPEIDCEILFAGGIHDDRSAAMVATLAAPLTGKGARIGVLMGTAYILTKEAVSAGAVLDGYQKLALEAKATRLLESGVGHATRVIESPIVKEFYAEKARMRREKQPPDAIRDQLERFNVGRARIASKGLDRNPDYGKAQGVEKLIRVPETDQLARGLYMIGQAASLHAEAMTISGLHGLVSEGSAAHLRAVTEAEAPRAATPSEEGPGARIAITGLGTLLPKAHELSEYWENILDQVDAIEEVPERRWDWRRYYDSDRDAPDKSYSRWGGFLDEITFDPLRYGIPPKSVPSIEPLQLLALEVVRSALENAGFKDGFIPDEKLRRRTCVIIGVGGGAGPLGQRYAVRSSLPAIAGGLSETAAGRLPEWTEDSFPGILLNVIAGRIANRFDLGGVNFTVDAACGSSLAAVMMAAREIETGSADMAIVGGADSFQNPFDFIAFAKTRALSPRGRCRTFDASADGIAISEGLAMMVLRRLDQAEQAGDRIYAVLRGVAGASDGRDLSLTAPRAEGQQEALRRAYARAGISPATVSAIEAHGTGTVVGDRTEIESLSAVFKEARADRQFCGVGSVKSMIGHTKAAAGCAGLAKMALALHHRVLPPTLHVEEPNPTANFAESPFYVISQTRPWLRYGATPRRAGVSAFGFGGTNFHAVLEEYDGGYLARHQEPFRRNWPHELYVFSAETPEALKEAAGRAAAGLAGVPAGIRGADIAASLAARFDPLAGARLAVVAASPGEAAERLETIAGQLDGQRRDLGAVDPRGAYFSAGAPLTADQVAFLFPGQGSQYPGMAADLAMTFPELRQFIEQASRWLSADLPEPLGDLVFPRPTLDGDELARQAERLKQTNVAQPAIGAISAGMLQIINGLGIGAGQMAGHSFGEYTALHAAGAFDAETLIRLAHARGDAIIRMAGEDLGAMLAVSADATTVRERLSGIEGVTLANINAPNQTVIAGRTPAIELAEAELGKAGVAFSRLPVACGFHSECVAPARDALAGVLEAAEIAAPARVVIGNAAAAPYPESPMQVKAQLANHLAAPVNFLGGIEAMYARGARLFLEIGPGAVLTRLAGRVLADRPHLAVSTDLKARSGPQQFLCAIGAAAAAGLPVKLDRLFAGRAEASLDVASWNITEPTPARAATLWKIDAANARPIAGEPSRRGFAARIEEDPVTDTPSPSVAAPRPVAAASAAPARANPVAGPAPTPAAMPPAGAAEGEAAVIMQRHNALMQQFLQNHRDVMMTWLGAAESRPSAAPVPAAAPAAAPPARTLVPAGVAAATAVAPEAARAPEPTAAAQPEPVVPAPSAAATATRVSEEAVTASLLDLVAERTGYPPEMLGSDLDLEADLGIDSIKRVEILGALRNRWLAAAGDAARERMGPVSRQRTVRSIVACFLEVVAEFKDGAEPAGAPAPEQASRTEPIVPCGEPEISEQAVSASLLELIADRTGYPSEMLSSDLDLEADLGIDSIKRVEILGELRNRWLAAAGDAARERMGPVSRERTVRSIVLRFLEIAEAFRGGATPAIVPQADPPVASRPDLSHWPARFVMVPCRTAAVTPQTALIAGRTYVVTDDGTELTDALIARIEGAGAQALRLAAEEDAAIRDKVAAVEGEIGGIFHLVPLTRRPAYAEMSAEDWSGAVDADLRVLYTLLSSLGSRLAETAGGFVVSASALGGAFGFDGTDTGCPSAAGAAGLLKSAKKEWEALHVRALDFAPGTGPAEALELLVDEAGRREGPVEIGWAGGNRSMLVAEPRPLDFAESVGIAGLDSQDVVLVTGGARGITARVVRHLAAHHGPRFVLLGSTPLDGAMPEAIATLPDARAIRAHLVAERKSAGKPLSPAEIEDEVRMLLKAREMNETIAAVRASGCEVEYLAADVRDPMAFAGAIEDVYARYGRIDVILHGAGIIEDKLIADKTPDSFERVVRTKTDSAYVLTHAIRRDEVKAVVFFASVAGRFGNRGQGDYGAGNEIVSKLARSLDAAWPGRVVAISWGPWDSGGMVSDEVKAQFERLGIEAIDPELGVAALEVELQGGVKGEPEVVWGRGPWEAEWAAPREAAE